MRIVLVHGFNVRDGGKHTIDKLAPYFIRAGYNVDTDEADYGFFSLWMVRFKKHSAIRRIIGALQNADAVVTHSNGANYTMKALNLLTGKKLHVFHLSPAVNRNTLFPESVKRAVVYFTRTDFWVWISGFLPFHPWGRMGYSGAKTNDSRIQNRDFTDIVKGHSDWFSDDNIEFIAGTIILELGGFNEQTN